MAIKITGEIDHIRYKNRTRIVTPYFNVYENIISAPREKLKDSFRRQKIKLSDNDLDILVKLLEKYHNNRTIKIYDELPKSIKKEINNAIKRMYNIGQRNLNYNSMTASMFDSILNEVGAGIALSKLSDGFNEETLKYEKKIRDSFDDIYMTAFNRLDEIQITDPDKAELLRAMKDAFERAKDFRLQVEYLHNDNPKNVKRYNLHYNSVMEEFYKLANTSIMKFDHPSELYDILRRFLPKEYNVDDIKRFLVLLIKPMLSLDFKKIPDVAYAFRVIDSIVQYKIRPKDKDIEIFVLIANIIDEINKIILKRDNEMKNIKKGRMNKNGISALPKR